MDATCLVVSLTCRASDGSGGSNEMERKMRTRRSGLVVLNQVA